LAALLCVGSAALAEEAHWNYGKGHGGPPEWSQLNPEFAVCKLGKFQSPIDIKGATKGDLPAIQFGYVAGQPKVVNNGHTIQVNVPAGSSITVGDHTYELLQFHFHSPAEEAVDGKRPPLVAHFVHKDAAGKLAVVAVHFEVGAENAALASVFAHLPAKAGTEAAPGGAPLDFAAALPAAHGYYEFEGSLTTPPCSEGVRWFVLQKHSTVSSGQLAAFKKLYPDNARPLQPVNGRPIHVSM
jgi:carbonic anhydrase